MAWTFRYFSRNFLPPVLADFSLSMSLCPPQSSSCSYFQRATGLIYCLFGLLLPSWWACPWVFLFSCICDSVSWIGCLPDSDTRDARTRQIRCPTNDIQVKSV